MLRNKKTHHRNLPYGRQHIDQQDIDSVVDVLKSDFLTDGPAVKGFEKALSDVFCVEDVVACSSGTAALHLAAMGFGIGKGVDDVVIVPAVTFSATANAPFMAGAQVVFADVDPDSGLIGLEQLEDAFHRAKGLGKPKAVFPVHLNGQVAPMGEISGFAKNNGLLVIEDASHALGGKYSRNGAMGEVGDAVLSDAVCFSFHPVKTLAMGEGGAVSSQDQRFINHIRQLRGHGITRNVDDFSEQSLSEAPSGDVNPWYYEMQHLGNNYRASDVHCALGASQLSKLRLFVEKRASLVRRYRERLTNALKGVELLKVANNQRPGWHLMVTLIDFANFGLDRASVMHELVKRGIRTQVHYIPVPWQPFWKRHADTPDLPNSKRYYERALSLPLFYSMSVEDVDFVVDNLLDVLAVHR